MFVVVRDLPGAEATDQAIRYRIDPTRCACCRMPAADLYVVEASDKKNRGLCRPCVEQSGDGGLIRRAKREDHQRRELLDRIRPR